MLFSVYLRRTRRPRRFAVAPLALGVWLLAMGLSSAASISYTVRSGDNPWDIAKKFDVPVEALMAANDLTETSVLQVGQKLSIPIEGNAELLAGADIAYLAYEVKSGDTLSQIAEDHEVSLAELLKANGLTRRSLIKVGMLLQIPVLVAADDLPDPNPDASSHTIRPGDNLSVIAAEYGVTVPELAAANQLTTKSILQVGALLTIPGEAPVEAAPAADDIDPHAPIGGGTNLLALDAVPAAPAEGEVTGEIVVHTVDKGDTVSHLAVQYGTTRAAIFAANDISGRDVLKLGTVLKIPKGTLVRDMAELEEGLERVQLAGLPSRDGGMGTRVTRYALQYLGTPYKWAGEDLKRGVDCSGYVLAVYRNFGIELPHSSKAQATVGRAVKRSQLAPGDIILFHTTRAGISHAGIYLGNNEFVHASTRGRVVKVDSLADGYYDRAYVTARRVL